MQRIELPQEGALTIHEEAIAIVQVLTTEGAELSVEDLVRFAVRVARATKPREDDRARVQPLGMTLWDWVSSKNIELMRVAGQPGVGDAILGLCRGATVWARRRGVEVCDIDVDRSYWTASGDLVTRFTKRVPMRIVTADEQLATEDEAKAKLAEEQRRERFVREGRAHDPEAIVTHAVAKDGNVQLQTIKLDTATR